ncbi:hypothetical protein BGZ94_007700 [Podila epigama]|nr:hypothetical protein BGZ94_007700 [Podila epigama]
MLPTVCRASTVKSLASKFIFTTPNSYNLVSRRFISNSKDDDSRPHTDSLMAIISDSISSQETAPPANEQFRMARGSFRKGDPGSNRMPFLIFDNVAQQIYKPSDLNDSKRSVYSAPPKPVDELKILNLNPIVEYKNAALLSNYITPLGRLMSREQTGLSAKNQRRLTKAVRRARAMCILSPTSKDL